MNGHISNTKPFCLESLYAGICGSQELFLTISMLVEQINCSIQKVKPELIIQVINTVDEVTPCNDDLLKFYIQVKIQ